MRMRVTCYINHFISQRFPLERIYIVKWAFHQKKLKEIDKLVVFLFLVVFITFCNNICFGVFMHLSESF